MSKLYGNPTNITGFRKIAKAHRNGRTPQQMLDLHEQRQANRPGTSEPSLVQWVIGRDKNIGKPSGVRTIPLGSHGANGIPACTDNRKRNWQSPLASVLRSYIQTKDCGRYSSRCTYTKYEYTARVESWGIVIGEHLHYRIDTAAGLKVETAKAPRGFRWDTDKNGIRFVSRTDARCDYHSTADDLLSGVDLRDMARKNLATRKANEAQIRQQKQDGKRALELIRKAEKEGATVCVKDSVRAGNCLAGTVTWATRHNLDPNGHYAPSQLSAIANGDGKKVALVIATAIRRHRVEMERGYAELADHRN
jgi:hypothetical protein